LTQLFFTLTLCLNLRECRECTSDGSCGGGGGGDEDEDDEDGVLRYDQEFAALMDVEAKASISTQTPFNFRVCWHEHKAIPGQRMEAKQEVMAQAVTCHSCCSHSTYRPTEWERKVRQCWAVDTSFRQHLSCQSAANRTGVRIDQESQHHPLSSSSLMLHMVSQP
jgi:hypothetical protein